MSDYERIARVIRHLDAHHTAQPSLAELAGQLGLSSFHFHRLFATWAGVTPKDFLQCLTLAHVKQLLRAGESVLDAALAAGLSGPGRLHDLCVSLEAASPGEMKSGGRGWQIVFGFAETPFGECMMAESPRGICHLAFTDGEDPAQTQAALRRNWPEATFTQNNRVARRRAAAIFSRTHGNTPRSNLRAFVKGSPFQVRVWTALLRIPPGSLTTYGRLAAAIGYPSAARAVGSAVGHNPVAYLIPCHRVIRETGVMGGYRWDPIRKRAMVAWESQ
jgi:AraC family transcriptional regulator, regulatory protein of adaptative response / methylated-DNA-[protein]-cysteine methyltransferase